MEGYAGCGALECCFSAFWEYVCSLEALLQLHSEEGVPPAGAALLSAVEHTPGQPLFCRPGVAVLRCFGHSIWDWEVG